MTTIPTLASDPCGRAEALREAKDKIVTGASVEEVEFMAGNGTRRRVKYGSANLASLDREIAQAEAACDRLNGRRERRFMVGGRP